jgi:hypothetical protein
MERSAAKRSPFSLVVGTDEDRETNCGVLQGSPSARKAVVE